AMTALARGRDNVAAPHLRAWLRHAERAVEAVHDRSGSDGIDRVSQANALLQLEHLQTYPVVARAQQERGLRLHAFWFDIANAEVLAYDPDQQRYVPLDEEQAKRLLHPDERWGRS
ncbi:MAG: carbonic anhydrase, partial [Myxococcales bacterium]